MFHGGAVEGAELLSISSATNCYIFWLNNAIVPYAKSPFKKGIVERLKGFKSK